MGFVVITRSKFICDVVIFYRYIDCHSPIGLRNDNTRVIHINTYCKYSPNFNGNSHPMRVNNDNFWIIFAIDGKRDL